MVFLSAVCWCLESQVTPGKKAVEKPQLLVLSRASYGDSYGLALGIGKENLR